MFKVFQEDKDFPKFLFYGVNSCRRMPLDTWTTAEQKQVRDGSGERWYLSGFHVFTDEDTVINWARTLSNIDGRAAVEIDIIGSRPKIHSRNNILLADKIIVTTARWEDRISIRELLKR